MKKLFLISLILLGTMGHILAQVKGIPYQAVARGNTGEVLQNQAVNIGFLIRQGAANGTVVYQETHAPVTNLFGLFSLVIGSGTAVTGTFDAIDWSANQYFLETTINGGSAGITEFQSVPYAKVSTEMQLADLTDVASTVPSNGQVLKYNGTAWAPGVDANTTYTAGAGLTLSGTTFSTVDQSITNEIQTLSISGTNLSLSNGGGSVAIPTGTPSQWTTTGSTIHYTAGNVGIGDATPLNTLTVGNGDKFQVSGTDGDVLFTDPQASIRFPALSAPGAAGMLQMFAGGTSNSDRMVISHSPGFPAWGLEYRDTTDVFFMRSSSGRKFAFELSSGNMGIGVEDPTFPLDAVGRFRLQADGNINNSPGIWFNNQSNNFSRAFIGMSEPDSVIGIFSQHLSKWAIEFEVMREPRIGINIPAGSPPRAELHLYHTNFGGSNDGVRIQNEGANDHYYNLYTSNTTGDFEFFHNGLKRGIINGTTGAYTAVSDERLKTNIASLGMVLPSVMQLQPRTYNYKDFDTQREVTGFVAQELEKVFPQFVFFGGDDQKLYSVDYGSMSVVALKAIQEQQTTIEVQQKEIEDLKARLEKLEAIILKN